MTMPNFLYVGAPRAGSTWIFEALRVHPQVFVPIAKYIKYYHDEQYHRGRAWYEGHFEKAGPKHLAVGELSAGYLYSEAAMLRIANDLPEARILVSIRNPIERDWSAYLHMKRNGTVTGSFQEEMNGTFRFISEYGHYDKYLPALFERFPREQVKVMLYDDLSRDPVEFARNIYSFLGVNCDFHDKRTEQPKYAATEARNKFVAKTTKKVARFVRSAGFINTIGMIKNFPGVQSVLYKPTAQKSAQMLSADDRTRLIEKHADGIRRLENMVGRDLSHWTA